MPELPEVEVIARLLSGALAGAQVESAVVTGVSTLKSFDPPLTSVEGSHIEGVRRRGKHLIVDFTNSTSLLVHLMSAGRLQVFDKRSSARDRTTRLGIRLRDGRELRLREFGAVQRAWAKVVSSLELEVDPALSSLGPEAWPETPPLKELLTAPRPLHSVLRDQRVIAGIGRSWVDEILHTARLSPFKRASALADQEADILRHAIATRLGAAVQLYESILSIPIPDKLPMPLTIHRKKGEACPRCAAPIEAVHYEEHDLCYCPPCQTGGKLLKDRRLSRLLK